MNFRSLSAAALATLALAAAGCAHRASIAGSDVLYLENGAELLGRLESADAGKLVFRTLDGRTVSPAHAEVQRVEIAPPGGTGPTLAALGDSDLEQWIRTAPSAEQLPGYDSVTLFQGARLTFREHGGVRRTYRSVVKILNENGKDAGTCSSSFLPDLQRWQLLHARSIAPDGTVRELAHTTMKESWPNADFPAYNRRKDVVFAVPYAEPGAVIDVEFAIDQDVDPEDLPYLFGYTFAGANPVLRRRAVVDAPARGGPTVRSWLLEQGDAWARRLQAGKKIYDQFPDGIVHTTARREGARLVTAWELERQVIVVSEPSMPNWWRFVPRVAAATERTWPGIAAYLDHEFERRAALDEEMRAFVRQAVGGKTGEEAARALYNRLVTRIRPVAVDPSQYSYLPHPAVEIWRNGYATQWDLTFLYAALLGDAGFTPRLLAAAARNAWRWQDEPPSIQQFNHLVVELETGSRLFYVSCSSDVVPFGQIPDALRGGRTLLISGGAGTVAALPGLRPEESATARTLRIEVDASGNALVTSRADYTGEAGSEQRWTKSQSEEQLRKRFSSAARGVFSNATLVSFKLSDRANLDEAVTEEFAYEVQPLAVISGGRYLALRMPGTAYQPVPAQDGQRRYDASIGTPWKERSRFEIVLGDGVAAAGLPDPVELTGRWGSFTRTVRQVDAGTIVIEDATVMSAYEVALADYPAYRIFHEQRQRAGRQHLVLDLRPQDGVPAQVGR